MKQPSLAPARNPIAGARVARELISEARWRIAALLCKHAPNYGAPTPLLQELLDGRDIGAVMAQFNAPLTPELLDELRGELEPDWS